jgi:RNA methyltransferase, TrmH family
MTNITSLQNPRVKHLVKLRDHKDQRKKDRLMLVEGWDEIQLALLSGLQPQDIFMAPELARQPLAPYAGEVLTVDSAVFEKISYRENPDGWLAIFPIPARTLQDLTLPSSPLIIVTEAVEKPGNLGAILRTADSAGIDAVLVTDPRVDLYNPNVVRASRGTLFTVPTIEINNAGALAFLRQHGIEILAAAPEAELEYSRADLRGPVAVVVGTEDKGLTDFWLGRADRRIKIPMFGKVNSLNLSVAVGLIVYEAVRQRSMQPG